MDRILPATFGRRSPFGKAMFVGKMLTIIPVLMFGNLVHVVWAKIFPSRARNGKLQKISQILHVVEGYGPVPLKCRMFVFRNPQKKLALVSPIRPEPATVDEVRALGEVEVIITPSLIHDTYAPEWSQLFPGAKVAAPASIKDQLSETFGKKQPPTKVTHSQEEALASFPGVTLHAPPTGAVSTGEQFYEILNDDGSRTLATIDLQENCSSHHMWFPFVAGAYGHCTTRMFKLIFVDDPAKLREFILNVICKIPRVNRLVFTHGEILEGEDVSSRMASAAVSDLR